MNQHPGRLGCGLGQLRYKLPASTSASRTSPLLTAVMELSPPAPCPTERWSAKRCPTAKSSLQAGKPAQGSKTGWWSFNHPSSLDLNPFASGMWLLQPSDLHYSTGGGLCCFVCCFFLNSIICWISMWSELMFWGEADFCRSRLKSKQYARRSSIACTYLALQRGGDLLTVCYLQTLPYMSSYINWFIIWKIRVIF